MVVVQLTELLAERPIAHPSQLTGVRWTSEGLVLQIEGTRWWRTPYGGDPTHGRIEFIFSGLLEGCIRPDEFDFSHDEVLEDFGLESIDDVPWAQPADFSVYASGPIPDPQALYVRLSDFLSEQGAFRRAGDYLNCAKKMSTFVELGRSGSCLVGRGPECIRALLSAELEAQCVRHNVLHTLADCSPAFVVTLGSSQFLCSQAQARLDV